MFSLLFLSAKIVAEEQYKRLEKKMQRNTEPVYYPDYLQLDKILEAQSLQSEKYTGQGAHDETLFIIIHQVYELWFKQILHELISVNEILGQKVVPEKALAKANARLERVKEIQTILINQLPILETMTPLDFLDFRDYLVPASGFQSIQFRTIEILLGLRIKDRVKFDQGSFYKRLSKEHRDMLLEKEKEPNLLELLEKWLERMPFLEFEGFKFWEKYRQAVEEMLEQDRNTIMNFSELSDDEKQAQLRELKATEISFNSLFDETLYKKIQAEGKRKISQKAMISALFIFLYQDEPILQQPFRLLSALVDIDENFSTWRYRHAMLAHRMLGTKIGTGGSSGHQYLKSAAENNRTFQDLFNLSTYLIPRKCLPPLPAQLQEILDFSFELSKRNQTGNKS